MDHAAPVAPPDQVALFICQSCGLESGILVREKRGTAFRLDQRMQKAVDPEALDATRKREGISAFKRFCAGELIADMPTIFGLN